MRGRGALSSPTKIDSGSPIPAPLAPRLGGRGAGGEGGRNHEPASGITMTERREDWLERLNQLYTPVVADVLDRLGYRNQCPRADIRPLYPRARICGFAMT